jgi:signal-transduction protein with cAMP-binding, CBS, and nucleotidyltransferase domain
VYKKDIAKMAILCYYPKKEMKSMKVKDIMYTQLYFIDPKATARDAAQLMAEKKVGSLLVQKDNDIVGIVTQGDIIERVLAKGKDAEDITVEKIKNYPLIMIDHETNVLEAADLLTKYKIRRLMVVKEGKIVGVISTKVIGANLPSLIK